MRIAVVTPKGGVGKTTVACQLAAMFSAGGKTLFVDIDSQGNATKFFLKGGKLPDSNNVAELFRRRVPVPLPVTFSLDIVGGNLQLSEFDSRSDLGYFFLLSKFLKAHCGQYDSVVIDTPPNLGMFTLNALLAADYALSVVDPSDDALDGLGVLVEAVAEMRADHNEKLSLAGVVLNAFDDRNNADRRIKEAAEGKFGSLLFDAVIPRTTKIRDARAEYKVVGEAFPGHPADVAFESLFKQLKERI